MLTACGQSDGPLKPVRRFRSQHPDSGRAGGQPRTAQGNCASSARPTAPSWATCCATGWPRPRASGSMATGKRPAHRRRSRPCFDRGRFATNIGFPDRHAATRLRFATFFRWLATALILSFARSFCLKRSLTGTDAAPILTPPARPSAAFSMRNRRRRNRRPGHARDERAVRSDRRGIRHRDRRVWGATMTAAALGYQVRLGSPWFDLLGTPIYHPWKLFEWWFSYGLCPGNLRHRRGHRWQQWHGRRGRRHCHVGLALAAGTPCHDLRIGPLGERA